MSTPRDKDMDVTRNTLAPDVSLHHLVRRSTYADLAPMADVLAAAFHDDPVVSWLMPDAGRRKADLPAMMRVFVARFQSHGENCVNETATGAALWLPPGATFTSEEDVRFETSFVSSVGQDIYLVGELTACKSGHALNNKLLHALRADPSAFEIVTFEDQRQAPISYQVPAIVGV